MARCSVGDSRLVNPAATAAAVRVARAAGLQPHDPVVLHQTNNTVVWLRPEAVVAKVATRPNARPGLRTEWGIASELVRFGADVAAPLSGVAPTIDEPTGFVVTLWDHVVGEQYVEIAPATVAQSLRRLHAALARLDLESCCTGPVEWDLAIPAEGFEVAFPGVDADLLGLLRTMNSARVATWCWGDPRIPEIRQLGELHLRLLHDRIGTLR